MRAWLCIMSDQRKLVCLDPSRKPQSKGCLPLAPHINPSERGCPAAESSHATPTNLLFIQLFAFLFTMLFLSVTKNPTPKVMVFSGKKSLGHLFQAGYVVLLLSKLFPKLNRGPG